MVDSVLQAPKLNWKPKVSGDQEVTASDATSTLAAVKAITRQPRVSGKRSPERFWRYDVIDTTSFVGEEGTGDIEEWVSASIVVIQPRVTPSSWFLKLLGYSILVAVTLLTALWLILAARLRKAGMKPLEEFVRLLSIEDLDAYVIFNECREGTSLYEAAMTNTVLPNGFWRRHWWRLVRAFSPYAELWTRLIHSSRPPEEQSAPAPGDEYLGIRLGAKGPQFCCTARGANLSGAGVPRGSWRHLDEYLGPNEEPTPNETTLIVPVAAPTPNDEPVTANLLVSWQRTQNPRHTKKASPTADAGSIPNPATPVGTASTAEDFSLDDFLK